MALATIWLLLVEHRQAVSHIENHTEAVYLAQAGVMQAIYDLKRGAGVALRAYNVNNPGGAAPSATQDAFILGCVSCGVTPALQSDYFLVNMTVAGASAVSPQPCGGGTSDRFSNWPVNNVLAAGGLTSTVDQIQVTWPSPGSERVTRIMLNGAYVTSCISVKSGIAINVTNTSIAPMGVWPASNNQVWFNSSGTMGAKASIDVTFIMTDGSSRTAHYDLATSTNRSADVTIKSIGEVRTGNFPFLVWRRLQAEYRVGTALNSAGRLLSYQELTRNSTP